MNIQQHLALKTKVEEWQRTAQKAEGAKEQLLERLKNDISCSTVASAKKFRDALQLEVEQIEKKYQAELDKLEPEWLEKMGDSK